MALTTKQLRSLESRVLAEPLQHATEVDELLNVLTPEAPSAQVAAACVALSTTLPRIASAAGVPLRAASSGSSGSSSDNNSASDKLPVKKKRVVAKVAMSSSDKKEGADALAKFGDWLQGVVQETWQRALQVLAKHADMRAVLATLTLAVDKICRWQSDADKGRFCVASFTAVVRAFLSNPELDGASRATFAERYMLNHVDTRHYFFVAVRSICNDETLSHSEAFLMNTCEQMLPFDVTDVDVCDVEGETLVSDGFVPELKRLAAVQSEAWMALLRLPLPHSVYKRVLVNIEKCVLPRVKDPLLLADLLKDSYDRGAGGVVSLLALNGLFVLMTRHNFNAIDDFYDKLYVLLSDSIFTSRYRARFFRLLELFLSSKYLPAYLAAAFAKKLARLALTAPPAAAIFVLASIYNLLRRYTNIQVLLHRPPQEQDDEPTQQEQEQEDTTAEPPKKKRRKNKKKNKRKKEQEEDKENTKQKEQSERQAPGVDPFDMQQTDPRLSRALESSLWEICSLRTHYCPQVAALADIFFSPTPPPTALNIEAFASRSYSSLFESERDENNVAPEDRDFNDVHFYDGFQPDVCCGSSAAGLNVVAMHFYDDIDDTTEGAADTPMDSAN